MPIKSRLSFALALTLIAGCAVGPDYERPAVEASAPAQWGEGAAAISSEPADLARWWTLFKDPELDSLIERAVRSNLDLALAESRVREARGEYRIAFGEILPSVTGSGSIVRDRFSANARSFPGPRYQTLYSAGFDAGWELDVFGGTRRGIEAASA